jgi:hypothetical protein
MAWTWGTNTLSPGQTQRWWLSWSTDPGIEMIGVQAITPGAEIDYTNPGMQVNADGSVLYFVTVTNNGRVPVQFHFTGSSRGSWTWGTNTLNAGQTQRWWLSWGGYPGLEIVEAQPSTPGCEIDFTASGVQVNADGSSVYFITVTNVGNKAAQFHFRGCVIC